MTTNTQPEKTKCISRQLGCNCPLDNKDADPDTFCEAYMQGDGYIDKKAAIPHLKSAIEFLKKSGK